jgi:hypothetical protein
MQIRSFIFYFMLGGTIESMVTVVGSQGKGHEQHLLQHFQS